ncbi:hypothetical protein AB6Q13_11495 [Ralstonia solanacearum]|uniref:hypothetical protein n=1 Tax=Ralstonia solanacearum TaxID=305 RepID=UPI0009BD6CFF|nr:hypothetical protein [Ralstonia solanacearum]MDB0566545.1 hypothetical protein [Ralstonia solanacearum]MDB0575772.1 hypothetical protein [Ralstonia solanacearum]
MAATSEPLKELEVGSYAEMAARPNPQHLAVQPVPALAAILLSVERKKGEPLTKEEVEVLRDNVNVMVVSAEAAKAVEDKRGYTDIEPSRAWQEWQVLRSQFR